jgi:hypothetical protein
MDKLSAFTPLSPFFGRFFTSITDFDHVAGGGGRGEHYTIPSPPTYSSMLHGQFFIHKVSFSFIFIAFNFLYHKGKGADDIYVYCPARFF